MDSKYILGSPIWEYKMKPRKNSLEPMSTSDKGEIIIVIVVLFLLSWAVPHLLSFLRGLLS